MKEITIKTDGTPEGTTLTEDGVDITATRKCIGINFYASAPYKSQYSGDKIPGQVSCSYECCNSEGTIERKSIYSTSNTPEEGIGASKETEDSVGKPSRAIRYIGQKVDEAVSVLVDKIIAHYEEKKAAHPTREVLLTRTYESLKDRAEDLGIILENKEPTNAV